MVSESESFPATGSVDVVAAVAVLSKIVPTAVPAGTDTVIVSVSIAPSTISPTVQTPAANAPVVTVELTNVTPAGIVSATVTAVASDGPKFSTVIV